MNRRVGSWLASGAVIPIVWQFSKLRRSGEPSGEKVAQALATAIPLQENYPQAMSADVPGGEGRVSTSWLADGVWAWMDNYCQAHPRQEIVDASKAFNRAHPPESA